MHAVRRDGQWRLAVCGQLRARVPTGGIAVPSSSHSKRMAEEAHGGHHGDWGGPARSGTLDGRTIATGSTIATVRSGTLRSAHMCSGEHCATSASTPLNAPHYSGRNRSPRRAAPGTQRTGSPARTYWPADCTRDSRTPRAAPPLPSQAHGGPPQRARSPGPCDAWSPQ